MTTNDVIPRPQPGDAGFGLPMTVNRNVVKMMESESALSPIGS